MPNKKSFVKIVKFKKKTIIWNLPRTLPTENRTNIQRKLFDTENNLNEYTTQYVHETAKEKRSESILILLKIKPKLF